MHPFNHFSLPHLCAQSEHLQTIVAYTQKMDCHVQQVARAHQAMLPPLACAPVARAQLGPKYPVHAFSYLDALDADSDERPLGERELFDEVASYFQGAIRPQSRHALFNMVPEPSMEATAAAWLTTAYNTNSLMDAFGGGALLIEQKVARRIGRWVGWHKAMGIACNGGKLTIMYAVKSALSRAAPDSLRTGLPHDLVILCSDGAHYCVEHVASVLGLGAERCIRVASSPTGNMCADALRRTLKAQHLRGNTVAAIICCGGTTINFHCEDTREVSAIVDTFVHEYGLKIRPYLHLDSVIGWLYLSQSAAQESTSVSNVTISARIAEVNRRLSGTVHFDSMGVDFHKNGLCPYASSFFIARDRRFMDELGDGQYRYTDNDFHFGQLRAYRYTLENTRPGQGILAAWINLRKLGRQGYADYLTGLHEARESVTAAFERHGQFPVLNRSSLGWEVIFDIPFEQDVLALAASRDTLAMTFMHECWARVNAGYDVPLFSIIPGYRIDNDPEHIITAFLLYPMRQRLDQEWDDTVMLIAAQLHDFQARLRKKRNVIDPLHVEQPIR